MLGRSRENEEEFPAFAANTILRLIIRALWCGDGNIESDAQRNLTPLGKQQAQQAAQWLGQRGIVVDVVVSSPLVRARQTAQPVAAALQIEIRENERLSGGRLTLEALASIVADADNPDSLLLVGHEPDFSTIIGQLTGGKVDIKKATLALVTCDDIKAGSGELAWLLPPAVRG